jgi:hypothetical protein
MLQLDINRVCESTTLNTLKREVFISQNTKGPVTADVFMDKSVSADTNRSPQIHLDLEQNVTEYTAFPRSKVLNGQEKKDDVLTL